MRRQWDAQELADHWSLSHDEFELVRNRTDRGRLGFVALLKFFQVEGRFPRGWQDVPPLALEYLAEQLDVSDTVVRAYEWQGRTGERDRARIRGRLGVRPATAVDAAALAEWLHREVLPRGHTAAHLREAAFDWCRAARIEPPSPSRLDRILGSALRAFEHRVFATVLAKPPTACRAALDGWLTAATGCPPQGT